MKHVNGGGGDSGGGEQFALPSIRTLVPCTKDLLVLAQLSISYQQQQKRRHLSRRWMRLAGCRQAVLKYPLKYWDTQWRCRLNSSSSPSILLSALFEAVQVKVRCVASGGAAEYSVSYQLNYWTNEQVYLSRERKRGPWTRPDRPTEGS